MAKGRVIGERPFAAGAFQPQNPGAKDANTALQHDPKRTPPTLVHIEGVLGGTMGASFAVAGALSRLQFLRVVLDFLFCCHKLENVFASGGCAAIGHDLAHPPFFVPKSSSKAINGASEKTGGGVRF
jgi:hypothetical protein